MPTIVGILIVISRKNFMLNWVEHEKSFITSGPDFLSTWRCWVTYSLGESCELVARAPVLATNLGHVFISCVSPLKFDFPLFSSITSFLYSTIPSVCFLPVSLRCLEFFPLYCWNAVWKSNSWYHHMPLTVLVHSVKSGISETCFWDFLATFNLSFILILQRF